MHRPLDYFTPTYVMGKVESSFWRRYVNVLRTELYEFLSIESSFLNLITALKGCDATQLFIIKCDLTDFSSIRACAKEMLAHEERIDILINNAGVMFLPKYERTVDGHEKIWQSNFLGKNNSLFKLSF
ncbi:unnamed protein product [Strongylus vulgaris]|uniref:Uncharacterized protein n=1 Tax=Strongylus vulgaris TaxID=40348 RepID=A0A3P7M018_STRVU|nr:unnamed protein product [Strongylus vulgaris]